MKSHGKLILPSAVSGAGWRLVNRGRYVFVPLKLHLLGNL